MESKVSFYQCTISKRKEKLERFSRVLQTLLLLLLLPCATFVAKEGALNKRREGGVGLLGTIEAAADRW